MNTLVAGKRIAIIGSGIAGLSAAWLLSKDHCVTLFERAEKPGMGIYSVDIPWARGITSIDIPLRVFTPGYYPDLLRLYQRAGVRTERTDHSAAYANEHNQLFFHYGNWLLGERSLGFPKSASPALFRQHLRLFSKLKSCKGDVRLKSMTFGGFISEQGLQSRYLSDVLMPALATVCTCDYRDIENYPADIIVDYLTCGVMDQGVMRATSGVDDVIARLLESPVTLRSNCTVQAVRKAGSDVEVVSKYGAETFDKVVIATQPHHAAELLASEKDLRHTVEHLHSIPLSVSRMQLHTDDSLLPRSLLPLSPITYFLPVDTQRPEVAVDLTRAISSLRHGDPLLQVWNPVREVAAAKLLADVTFSRPLVTMKSRQAVSSLRDSQGESDAILLTGSYLCDGIPLLDGAVKSSLHIARLIGSSRCWEA